MAASTSLNHDYMTKVGELADWLRGISEENNWVTYRDTNSSIVENVKHCIHDDRLLKTKFLVDTMEPGFKGNIFRIRGRFQGTLLPTRGVNFPARVTFIISDKNATIDGHPIKIGGVHDVTKYTILRVDENDTIYLNAMFTANPS